MKLLIVEDDEDTASFMQYVLEAESHIVRTAGAAGGAVHVGHSRMAGEHS